MCLCTGFAINGDRLDFKNFTIVNGAQTVNTIRRFLSENPAHTDPIWVVAKVLRVAESDVKSAAELTESSNSQNSTSSRDIRATDIAHPRLETWLKREFDLAYVYKRGQRAPDAVRMKELAQAYVSFWRQEPNISFARAGQIFKENLYYEDVFPPGKLDDLMRAGDPTQIRKFLLERLVPWKISSGIRQFLGDNTGEGKRYDKKYRSMTYHLTWLYYLILQDRIDRLDMIYQRIDRILGVSQETLFEKVHDYLDDVEAVVPRDLKSETARTKLEAFVAKTRFQEIRNGVLRELE